MQPFEFGYAVGQSEKSAGIGDFARGAWDVGKYMIPGLGTAYSLGDAWNSARQGHLLGTVGNLALAGSSLIPGAGGLLTGAAKGIGKGLLRGGIRVGANTALGGAARTAGRAAFKLPGAMNAAGQVAKNVNSTMANAVQRIVPVNAATPYMTRKIINTAVKNPMSTVGYGSMLAGRGGGGIGATPAGSQMAQPVAQPVAQSYGQQYGQVPRVNW